MISIRYYNVPTFLQCGTLYDSFVKDELDEEISIPASCFSAEDSVESNDDFIRMLKVTAFWGLNHVPTSLIQYCKETNPSIWNNHVRNECTELDFAQDLLSVFIELGGSTFASHETSLCRAVAIGRDEIVAFLAVEVCSSTEPVECAAARGRLDYIQLLHKQGQPWDATACAIAAKNGHLHCLTFLHEHGCGWDSRVHLEAAEHGHLSCVKYALEQGLPWPDSEFLAYYSMCTTIVNGNCLELLQYGIENGLPLCADALVTAATQGQLDFVYALLDAHCPTNDDTTWYACQAGHFDILQVLNQYGVPFHASATSVAAEKGDLDILIYLHENGGSWNEDATLSAVRAGQVNTLRYAIESGCPYDEEIIYHAVQCVTEGGLLCLQYLLREAQLYEENGVLTLVAAFIIGNYQAIECLLDHGAPYNRQYVDIEDEIMAGIFNHLQEIGCTLEYDERLQKCIQCASRHNLDFVAQGSRFAEYICDNKYYLPLCAAFYLA